MSQVPYRLHYAARPRITLPILIFYPHPKLFLHFGQTVHLKKKMEEKACIFEDFFYFDMNPIALRKAKIVYNRVKRKTVVLSRTERSSSLQYFLIS